MRYNSIDSIFWGDNKMAAQAEDSAVSNFREYLRIKTVQPNPDIGKKLNVAASLVRAILLPMCPLDLFRGRRCVFETPSCRHWSGVQGCGGQYCESVVLRMSMSA